MDGSFPSIQHGLLTHDFPFHDHDCWEIHVFTGGRGVLAQDGVRWEVSAGSLTLSPPRHGHELAVSDSLAFFYVQFDGEKDAAVLRRLLERQTAQGPLVADPSIIADAGRLKDKLGSPEPDRVASGLHGFRAWLYDLAAGHSEPEPDGVDRSLTWLRQNLARRVELDDLASVANLDRFSFCRRFKARTGLSPLAYVHRSKIEAAGFLLAGTTMPLAEVALRLGFCDEFHFSKVFKKWRGVTPGRWRRSQQPVGTQV